MHGDAHLVFSDELSDIVELVLRCFLPGERADGMGSKGDEVRSNPKKKEPMLKIKS
jgi:hypothetical protein